MEQVQMKSAFSEIVRNERKAALERRATNKATNNSNSINNGAVIPNNIRVLDEERDVHQSPQKHGDARSVDTPATFVGIHVKKDTVASEHSSMTDDSMYTDDSSDDDDDDDDDDSKATKELLQLATIRLDQQELRDEVKALKAVLHNKDEQLLFLTSQLRRATASKCDLVNAVTDIEREKEMIEQAGEAQIEELKKDYLKMLESRAHMEREFMNELATLSERMMKMEQRFKNEQLEKDFVIANLEEELRKSMSPKAFSARSVRKG
jgi:hypothetical protein